MLNTCRNAGSSVAHPARMAATSAVFLLALPTQPPATCIAAVEDEIGDPLRVPRGVGHRDRRALRDAQQRKPVQAGGVDDRLQITDPGLDRRLADLRVRKAAAALVVTHNSVALAEPIEPMAPDRAFPVQLEMGQPGRDPYQRRTAAVHRVGQAHPVRRGAKPDLSHHARTLNLPRASPCSRPSSDTTSVHNLLRALDCAPYRSAAVSLTAFHGASTVTGNASGPHQTRAFRPRDRTTRTASGPSQVTPALRPSNTKPMITMVSRHSELLRFGGRRR